MSYAPRIIVDVFLGRLRKSGNSITVAIPREELDLMGAKVNDTVLVRIRLIETPVEDAPSLLSVFQRALPEWVQQQVQGRQFKSLEAYMQTVVTLLHAEGTTRVLRERREELEQAPAEPDLLNEIESHLHEEGTHNSKSSVEPMA